MQRAIWKFPVQVTDRFEIAMPYEAEILCCQMPGDTPCIWALVSPGVPMEVRKFRLAGTGHTLFESVLTFIDSFQMMDGGLVFHLFEVEP